MAGPTESYTVKVPDVGEGIAEVELVSWSVAEGEPIKRHQIVAEVMTDKATVEVPSPVDGHVEDLSGEVGDVLAVGSTLFTLLVAEGAAGPENVRTHRPIAEADPTVQPSIKALERPVPPAATVANVTTATATATAPRPEGRRPTATPAVRKRARDGGIDLRSVHGTGPAGRITHEDLDQVFSSSQHEAGGLRSSQSASGHSDPVRVARTNVDEQPIIGLRRKIAEQMVASTSTIPHITYVEEIDMTALEDLRRSLNELAGEEQPKLTLLPFLIRAIANQVPSFPNMNAHVIDEVVDGEPTGSRPKQLLRTFGGVHVGIATQTDNGLIVPVLRHAEAETIWSSATRVADLAERARLSALDPSEVSGSTITISSLGALGGVVTTPVINKPEVAILGVNKIAVRPVWIDGEFVPRKIMNLSSSFDHRVIDGWDAARFVQALKGMLEQPALLFIDQP